MILNSLKVTKLGKCVAFLCVITSSTVAIAKDVSPIGFTQAEIAQHQQNINTLTEVSSACLDAYYEDHVTFFKKNGFSKYYGNRNPIYGTTELRRRALISLNKDPKLEKEMEPIACIDLAMHCLEAGFEAIGQDKVWDRIYNVLKIDNNFYGTELLKMLQGLGWKITYWNPDPSQNANWDKKDRELNPLKKGREWMPVWGGHAYHYATAMSKKSHYYGIPVDDREMLVGFGRRAPEEFKQIQFFVGIAHAGYHVFPGSFGRVVEAHSMRKISGIDNFEVSKFDPLGDTAGGPRSTKSEKYRSGLIAVPPSN